MKKLFIVDSYPNLEKQISILKKCIGSIQPSGWDIMVVSHCPIPREIQDEVTYCIYDKNNLFVPPYLSPHNFSSNDIFDFKVYLGGHALAITINMFNGFKFAQNYGYDFCYFIEGDLILSHLDLKKLEVLVDSMEREEKDMIIFNPPDYIVRDCYYREEGSFFYETLLFGAKIDQFLSIFNPPRNLEEWTENDMCYHLESSLYHKYKGLTDRCLIVPSFVEKYLSESEINVSRFGLFICDLVYNKNNSENPILLINNLIQNKSIKEIKIFVNEILEETVTSHPGTWYYRPFSLCGSVLKIEVFDEGALESSKIIYLNSSLVNYLEEKMSFISFK